jgi:hypothetical protein
MSEFKAILDPIVDLLNRKNSDYGDSYAETRDEFGPTAFIIRLMDKYNRLKKLTSEETALVNEESIEDTIQDIIGYCTLELRYLRQNRTCG